MAFEPRRFQSSPNKPLVSISSLERAFVVNLSPGKDLCDALQVAKSLAKRKFRNKDVRFTHIFKVEHQKYVVVVEVVQDANVGPENANPK